jgi:hypothetical protein
MVQRDEVPPLTTDAYAFLTIRPLCAHGPRTAPCSFAPPRRPGSYLSGLRKCCEQMIQQGPTESLPSKE